MQFAFDFYRGKPKDAGQSLSVLRTEPITITFAYFFISYLLLVTRGARGEESPDSRFGASQVNVAANSRPGRLERCEQRRRVPKGMRRRAYNLLCARRVSMATSGYETAKSLRGARQIIFAVFAEIGSRTSTAVMPCQEK